MFKTGDVVRTIKQDSLIDIKIGTKFFVTYSSYDRLILQHIDGRCLFDFNNSPTANYYKDFFIIIGKPKLRKKNVQSGR